MHSIGVTHRTNVSNTPATNSTNRNNLLNKIAASTGPVKNMMDAKAYLEQRSLIVINNNFDLDNLANLLISASFDPKIPDQTMNLRRAIGLLLVSKYTNNLADEIAVAVSEKLQSASNHLTKQLNHDNKFITAITADQAKHTQKLHKISTTTESLMLRIKTTSNKLNDTTSNLQTSTQKLLDMTTQLNSALSSTQSTMHIESIHSLADSAKSLAKVVESLKKNCNAATLSTPPPPPTPPHSAPMPISWPPTPTPTIPIPIPQPPCYN